jgi:RimJ/RimL family protein N-acetyltransferase
MPPGPAELSTARLHLRPLTLADAPFILGLLNQPSYLRFIGDRDVRTVADAERYLADGPLAGYARWGHGLLAATLDGAPIGTCGLLRRDALPDPDLGFAFLPAYWSRGLAREAAEAVLAHGKLTLGLLRIVAICDHDNLPSITLLGRLGLRYERAIELDGESLRLHGWTAPS